MPVPTPVTVCVFAYNEERTIATTLATVLGQDCIDRFATILVGVNGCTDRTADRVRDVARAHPLVQLLEVHERGKSNMWNVFRRTVTTPLAIFLDGDQELAPSASRLLLAALDADPGLALAGGDSLEIYHPGRYLSWLFSAPAEPRTGVTGRLYGANMANLDAGLRRAGFTEIPRSVLHEDAFLTYALEARELCIVDEARCFCPMPLIRERLAKEVRSQAAVFQLEAEYPQFGRRMAEQARTTRRANSRLARFRSIESPVKRLVTIATYPARSIVLAVASAIIRRRARAYYESRECHRNWIRIESEKLPTGGAPASSRPA